MITRDKYSALVLDRQCHFLADISTNVNLKRGHFDDDDDLVTNGDQSTQTLTINIRKKVFKKNKTRKTSDQIKSDLAFSIVYDMNKI